MDVWTRNSKIRRTAEPEYSGSAGHIRRLISAAEHTRLNTAQQRDTGPGINNTPVRAEPGEPAAHPNSKQERGWLKGTLPHAITLLIDKAKRRAATTMGGNKNGARLKGNLPHTGTTLLTNTTR